MNTVEYGKSVLLKQVLDELEKAEKKNKVLKKLLVSSSLFVTNRGLLARINEALGEGK